MQIAAFALLIGVQGCSAFLITPQSHVQRFAPQSVLSKSGMWGVTNAVMQQSKFSQNPFRNRRSRPSSKMFFHDKFKSTTLRSATSVVEDVIEQNADGVLSTTSADASKRTPITQYFKPLVEGDILESTAPQQAIVAASSILLAGMVAKAGWLISADPSSFSGVLGAMSVLLGYEFADFGSGVYHWAMDNYGNKNTPIFGGQIEAFQGHHELPWTITYRQACNNIYKVCQASSPFCMASLLFVSNPYLLIWLTTGILFINLSQELHKWSHNSPSDTHPIINGLQAANIIVSRKSHLAHHRPPFENNYCIVSGHCNPVLDKVGFFRLLEETVFKLNGVKARCWTGERLLADRVEELGLKGSRR